MWGWWEGGSNSGTSNFVLLTGYYWRDQVKEGEMHGTYSTVCLLVGKPEGKRGRHRWEGNIKIDVKK